LLPDADLPDALKDSQSTYARDWKFLATGNTFNVEGKQVHGLDLPQEDISQQCHALDSRIRIVSWRPTKPVRERESIMSRNRSHLSKVLDKTRTKSLYSRAPGGC